MNRNLLGCIVTPDYLADGLTLGCSLAENDSTTDCILFVTGSIKDISLEEFNVKKIVDISSIIGLKLLSDLQRKFSPFELCCALRGTIHKWIYNHTDYDKWIMCDADMFIMSKLDNIWEALDSSSIFLTSHLSQFESSYHFEQFEIGILNHGLYNAGIVGFSRSLESLNAIQWLEERLLKYSYSGISRDTSMASKKLSLFVDQLWLNLLPIYFSSVYISFDPTNNLGHWNLLEGSLDYNNKIGEFTFNEQPIKIAHFSGVDSNNPELVSKFSSFYTSKPSPIWVKMWNVYNSKKNIIKNMIPHYHKKHVKPRMGVFSLVKLSNLFLKAGYIAHKYAYQDFNEKHN